MIVFELGLENVFSLGVQVGSRTGGWGPDLLELLCIGLFISFVDNVLINGVLTQLVFDVVEDVLYRIQVWTAGGYRKLPSTNIFHGIDGPCH